MQDKAEDKAKLRRESFILFLFLLIAAYVLAAHSPAMAQSDPGNQSDSKEEKDAKQPVSIYRIPDWQWEFRV